ncbi:MAG: biotin/lipoyl-containing protein, partial [Solirubrobacterales bacterium]
MTDIVMPRLSDSMTEGTVVRWLKGPGQTIARGELLVEIETDKATITYESDTDGVIAEILVGEGQTVPVGAQIARVEPAGSAGDSGAPQATGEFAVRPETGQYAAEAQAGEFTQPPTAEHGIAAESPPAAVGQSHYDDPGSDPGAHAPVAGGGGRGDDSRVKASPIARRLARKLGVDLSTVVATGPGGRVVKEDVEAAASAVSTGTPSPPTQAPAVGQPAEFSPLPLPDDPLHHPDPLPLPADETVYAQPQQPAGEEPAVTLQTEQADQTEWTPVEPEPALSPPGGGPAMAPPDSVPQASITPPAFPAPAGQPAVPGAGPP